MNLQIFAIYDKKAQFFSPPFVNRNKGEALRTLEDLANDPQTRINKHPADFQIFELGEWDEVTGKITPVSQPKFLEEASSFKKPEVKNAH